MGLQLAEKFSTINRYKIDYVFLNDNEELESILDKIDNDFSAVYNIWDNHLSRFIYSNDEIEYEFFTSLVIEVDRLNNDYYLYRNLIDSYIHGR